MSLDCAAPKAESTVRMLVWVLASRDDSHIPALLCTRAVVRTRVDTRSPPPTASLPLGPRHKRSKSLRHRHRYALHLSLAGPSCPHGYELYGHVRLAPGGARLDEQCAAEDHGVPMSVEQRVAVLGYRARRGRTSAEQSDFSLARKITLFGGGLPLLEQHHALPDVLRTSGSCLQLRAADANAHLPAALKPS
jgi:hypothetical protein